MMGRGGSYFVSKDRETREAKRRDVAASVAASVEATPAGLSQLVLVQRPVEMVVPYTEGSTVGRAADQMFSGNQEFVSGHYVSAIDKYSQALRQLAIHGRESEGIGAALTRNVKITCLLNRAACQLESGNFSACAQDCAEVLTLDSGSVAAIVRRALAFERQSQFGDAEDALRLAIELAPDDKELAKHLAAVTSKKARAAEVDSEQEFDWSKYGMADSVKDGAVATQSASATSAAPQAATENGSQTPDCGLAAQLGQLAVVRGPLKRKEWKGAAELQAMDPVSLTRQTNKMEDDDADEGDAWMAQAYGEADFSAKDDEPGKGSDGGETPKDNGEGGGEEEDEADTDEAPPGWDDDDATGKEVDLPANDDDELDGMPALENPDS